MREREGDRHVSCHFFPDDEVVLECQFDHAAAAEFIEIADGQRGVSAKISRRVGSRERIVQRPKPARARSADVAR